MKTLFFAFNGHYEYTAVESYAWSYSCFTMAHVIITWVFLLNFLIAIMNRTYYAMLEKGDFLYKKTKYQYIEKYSIPLLNPHGYEELIITPSPLNAFTLIMLPFSVSKTLTTHMAKCYS
jgi:hypothetical protein